MKKVFYIMAKEIKDFFLDKGDLSFSLLLPILIFGLMYGAFGNANQFNGTAYVVNQDTNGKYSAQLLDTLAQTQGLKIEKIALVDADSRLQRSNIQMAIVIPVDFSAKLEGGKSTEIIYKQRGNGSTEGQITASIVRGIAEDINQQVQLRQKVQADLAGASLSSSQIDQAVTAATTAENLNPGVKIVEDTLGQTTDPVSQFLPGIMTMFVLFAVNLTAQSLVDERRKGTLERLLATRLTAGELFFGKFLAFTARGFIQTIILLLLAYVVFGLFTPVTFLEAAVLALIFAAACSALGIIIGSVAKTQNQASWIAVFFTMLMVMLSGTFVAISSGGTLATLSKISVNTYANDAFRKIIIDKASLGGVTFDILVLLGVAVIGLAISRILFKASQGGK